jgi:hypothetical protein
MSASDLLSVVPVEDLANSAAPVAEGSAYFGRRLRSSDEASMHDLNEVSLLAIKGPKVVLGDPGMGKSELLSELGRQLDSRPVSAIRFLLSKDPTKLVRPGKPLLIDGLDEAMARREGDAVDAIIQQLEDAGSPDFVLSCRAREWQARGESNLRQLYGADPKVFSIEPLSRAEAQAFLVGRYPQADADQVLDHLDEHGLGDLYSNPLMLSLMGRVAEADIKLPASRGALFERVCVLIWPEHNPDRQDTGLAQLTEEAALAAAGAISAALLFGGAEAVSAAGAVELHEGDLRIADIEALPDASAARTVFASKLFQTVGLNRAKPIHRVIAEFLAARWLATQASTPRMQRRLLAQLHGSGGVPASLRGLHALLAYHSPTLAERVIAADPYGVLRYGETGALTPRQAEVLFDSLEVLAQDDPYFRSSDWDSRTADGLMVPALRDRIDAVIASPASNSHLRSLLIEGLKGTAMAGELAITLETIMLSPERFYREREDAAEALLPHRGPDWWRQAIEQLLESVDRDAGRLARSLVEFVDGQVPDALLVASIFAELGLTLSAVPRVKTRQIHTVRHFGGIAKLLPIERVPAVLDLIADYAELIGDEDWQDANDVAELASDLIVRAIDEGAVGSDGGAALWHWLGIVEHARRFRRDVKKELFQRLSDHPTLRRAAQVHALCSARRKDTLWAAEFDLDQRLIGLTSREGDVVWFLERLAGADNKDEALREDWCDLMRLGRSASGLNPDVRDAGEKFRGGDRRLAAFLAKLENPKQPAWQRKHEREAAKRARKESIAMETHRRHYAANLAGMTAGELNYILEPARAYLGHYSDLPREVPGPERIEAWLGPTLRAAALDGIEAVLHQSDLPSVLEVAQGFAEDMTYNYGLAIMAGLFERHRSGRGLVGVPADVLVIGLLLAHHDACFGHDDCGDLRTALESAVIPTQAARETFARILIEPSLRAGQQHVGGLYQLAHDPPWLATGSALADDWLMRFPDVPESVESALVDCLTHAGELDKLRQVAIARSTTVFRNFDHMLSWLAIDVLVRFDAVRADLAGVGAGDSDFLWFLRNRLQFERRGAMLSLSIEQAAWVVSEFRAHFPYATLEGSGQGNTNPYDATDFLRALVNRLANDTSVEASHALAALIAGPVDTYTELIRHMAAEQRQKRAEANFSPLLPLGLGELLIDGPPSNADDLKALVLEELAVAQKKLFGEDVDQIRDFWTDNGIPRDENRCRDRLAAMIGPELSRYDIQRITEADMPATKRADLAFARSALQLPMEVKGQWHKDVWDAASDQLDAQYLIDWRSDQRGIYCVLWFGDQPSKSGRRLKPPPEGVEPPVTAEAMRTILIDRIPEARRALIEVVVLDLTGAEH